jgi:hypothetical protein
VLRPRTRRLFMLPSEWSELSAALAASLGACLLTAKVAPREAPHSGSNQAAAAFTEAPLPIAHSVVPHWTALHFDASLMP